MQDAPLRKKLLRDRARAIRSSLTPGEIEEKSACICRHLSGVLEGIDPVMVYVSKPLEVNTRDLIEHLISRSGRVIVPVIETDTRTLRLSYIGSTSVLVRSTFQVHEPVGNEIPARPGEVRAVVVPMLAFDHAGNRLGYGAGYYDRFLSAHPYIKKIGIAFTCLETGRIPCEPSDIRMDLIVTEDGTLDCSR
jgi:5-formyltetrahydrofolate cyclo-ligase